MRVLALFLRIMGVGVASGLMGRIWQTVGPLTWRQKRVIDNLQLIFPDLPHEDLAAIARQQWNNLGRTFAESFMIDRFIADTGRIAFQQQDLFDDLAQSGKGFVLVSLHTGNWELVSLPIAERFELTGLYQQLSNPRADRYLSAMREQVYRGGLLSKSVNTPKTVMKIVRGGGGVAMLVDQREKKGVDVEFFGQPTRANPFPAMVARRLDVPLIAGRTIRLSGARFRVEGQEIQVPRTDDVTEDVQVATQAIQSQLETWIKEYPGQWMWVHDRWRPNRPRRRRRIQELDKSDPSAN